MRVNQLQVFGRRETVGEEVERNLCPLRTTRATLFSISESCRFYENKWPKSLEGIDGWPKALDHCLPNDLPPVAFLCFINLFTLLFVWALKSVHFGPFVIYCMNKFHPMLCFRLVMTLPLMYLDIFDYLSSFI